MAADSKAKWQEAKRQILLALDLPAEYAALGLQLAGGAHPNAKGWIDAHAFGMQDRTPSAGINVHDCPFLGRYHNFRDPADNCGFFDFAIRAKGGTYAEVLKHFATKTNVKLPGDLEERTVDRLEFGANGGEPTIGGLLLYANGKAGVTVRAMKEVGLKVAYWPKNLSASLTNHLYVAPMYGSSNLIEFEPTAYHGTCQHPQRKIRKFKGKGVEEELLDKMTWGEYGLMNVDGLRRLKDATVVNIVEGLTDLLAGQAKLGEWRDGATADDPREHVVLSAGGCKNHCKPEWVQHFAGKEIRLWFDVGDGKNEGQIAASLWASALMPVASIVRNVQLPLGKDGGKNDLRAWLTESLGSPEDNGHAATRGYADMDAYARTFEPMQPTDPTANVSPQEALLKNLGLVVIGEHEGTQKVEIYSEHTRKSGTINDLDKLTVAKLIQYLGVEAVEEHVHDGKEPQPGKYQLKDVKNAIAAAASDKLFHGEERYGAGVWPGAEAGELVLVKAGELGIVKGSKIEKSYIPFVGGRHFDIAQSTGNWCDFSVLGRYLVEAERDRWCQDVFEEADTLFCKWYWKQSPAPRIVTAMLIASFLQSLWAWRPQMFITGSSDTGKSLLIGETLPQIFGPLAMYVHKPTEAALRQHIRHHGKVVFVDEFELDAHRQKVLELFRTSSQKGGGRTIRGTADQKGTSFQLRHIPWFAAIETGLRKQADKNRYIILDMLEVPKSIRGSIDIPTDDRLADLGQRLLAVGLRHFYRSRDLAAELKKVQVEGAPGRVVETFSVPCSIYSAVFGHAYHEAVANMRHWMGPWDFSDQAARDDVNVLVEILTSEVVLDHGVRKTVGQMLETPLDPDHKPALARVGIAKVVKRGNRSGDMVLFLAPTVLRRNLLSRGSEYQGHAIEQYLLRLKGATRGHQRLGGQHYVGGVEIPVETLDETLGANDEEKDEVSESRESENTNNAGEF